MFRITNVFMTWNATYFVIPQKPHLPQQTFRGHFWPGIAAFLPHSALASQLDQHTSLGDIPDVPQALHRKKKILVIFQRIPTQITKTTGRARKNHCSTSRPTGKRGSGDILLAVVTLTSCLRTTSFVFARAVGAAGIVIATNYLSSKQGRELGASYQRHASLK